VPSIRKLDTIEYLDDFLNQGIETNREKVNISPINDDSFGESIFQKYQQSNQNSENKSKASKNQSEKSVDFSLSEKKIDEVDEFKS
jgi:hypothetical protein